MKPLYSLYSLKRDTLGCLLCGTFVLLVLLGTRHVSVCLLCGTFVLPVLLGTRHVGVSAVWDFLYSSYSFEQDTYVCLLCGTFCTPWNRTRGVSAVWDFLYSLYSLEQNTRGCLLCVELGCNPIRLSLCVTHWLFFYPRNIVVDQLVPI